MTSVNVVEGDSIGSDPTLRPLADVGMYTVMVKGKKVRESPREAADGSEAIPNPGTASEPGTEAQESPGDDSERDRLESVGFQLVHGVFRRDGRGV